MAPSLEEDPRLSAPAASQPTVPPPPPPIPTVSVSVQTPNKLLKGLILESGSKSQSAAVHEAVKAAEKKFKHYIEKVSAG